MPALPALLLSTHFLLFLLLLTMAPHSLTQNPALAAVRMGKDTPAMRVCVCVRVCHALCLYILNSP